MAILCKRQQRERERDGENKRNVEREKEMWREWRFLDRKRGMSEGGEVSAYDTLFSSPSSIC